MALPLRMVETGMPGFSSQHLFDVALAHHRAGRLEAAVTGYGQVLAQCPGHADALHLLGTALLGLGQPVQAAEAIAAAIAQAPHVALYYLSMAQVLVQSGMADDAMACLSTAVQLDPNFAEAHFQLAHSHEQRGQLGLAAEHYHRAVSLRPTHAASHNNLGIVFKRLGRLDLAVECARAAVDLAPGIAELRFNLGAVLDDVGQVEPAMAAYRAAIALKPDYAEAHNNLALALLSRGAMAEGWREYEWRWLGADLAAARRCFDQPQWRGEPAVGKVLLVHAEQGLGDSLQFCRYLPLVAARGLRLVFEVPRSLQRLMASLDGVERVITRDELPPAFDLHCPLLSLPAALAGSVPDFPASPAYLWPDAALVAQWRERLAASLPPGGMRVGLVWAGASHLDSARGRAMDARRSVPLPQLAPLFQVPGIHFVSLQKDAAAEARVYPLTDLMDHVTDFADTAALAANLDLIISVDTAVVHLAGALGRPTWLMDRHDPCWRWLRGRDDSPWYPSLRLFRQTRAGDWGGVAERVAKALTALGDPGGETPPGTGITAESERPGNH